MKKLLLLTIMVFSLFLYSQNQASAAVINWQKGISVQPMSAQDFGSDSFRRSMDKALADGVNSVSLVIPLHQDNIRSSTVYAGGDTPTDQSLVSATQYLRSKGANVTYAVHINPYDGQWRAMISADNRPQWFASYTSQLQHYGRIAQTNGAYQLILGTELSSMTNPAYNSGNTQGWNQLIQAVRSVYNGSLTYSAQRTGYMSDAQQLEFWPQLDKIGISAYYSLGDNNYPSESELKQYWANWNSQELKVLNDRYNKPILFTEIGYVSRDGALRDPGTGYQLGTPYNQDVQAAAYQALFSYWNDFAYMQGVSIWDWSSNPDAGGANDGGYTPQGKKAEAVMKDWFTRTGSGGVITPPVISSYTTSAQLNGTATKNSPATITAKASSTQPVSNTIVDVEIYNQQGQRVHQQFYENQSLSATPKDYNVTWTPNTSGPYTVKMGIFTSGWSSNLTWNDTAGAFTVAETTQPPVTTPSPTQPPVTQPPVTPTQPPTTTPTTPTNPTTPPPTTTPTQPPAPASLSIWWPGSTQPVSGVQPYKAVIDGKSLGDYKMYWQVDGGQLNEMYDSSVDAPHKESSVDMSGWQWSPTKRYTITFVAKNNSGAEIARNQVVITLQ